VKTRSTWKAASNNPVAASSFQTRLSESRNKRNAPLTRPPCGSISGPHLRAGPRPIPYPSRAAPRAGRGAGRAGQRLRAATAGSLFRQFVARGEFRLALTFSLKIMRTRRGAQAAAFPHAGEEDHFAFAQERDPIADTRRLSDSTWDDMKMVAPPRLNVSKQAVERLLHERIEALGWARPESAAEGSPGRPG